ncbi:MAG: CAP family protein [Verrucomicrobiota bacterium]
MRLILSFVLVLTVAASAQERKKIKDDDVRAALEIHNKAREEVGVPALKLSDELAKSAQAYADVLAKKDEGMEHSKGLGVSENLSIFGSTSPMAVQKLLGKIGKLSAEGWYADKAEYDRLGAPKIRADGYPGQREMIGHYTAMVWRESTHVGFGAAIGKKTFRVYVVAHYSPRGNAVGEHPYKKDE